MAYYGIYIPPEKQAAIDEKPPYVFDSRDAAFQMLRKNRDSRLKAFKTHDEAKSFSILGIENGATSTTNFNECGEQTNGVKAANPEKVSSFRGPTSQELVKFRKSIEQGNYESVYDTIWTNPRYLIGSGDTPSILKESFRYNALHVAALAKNAKICKLILETISDPKFVQLLHGKDDKRTAEEVSLILLDLYLNMPEKGRSETPLHLASKYGALEVIEVLTSYKSCQMTANSDGLFPKDMVCFRTDTAPPTTVAAIKALLQERFYVPVMRTNDNSAPPVIGEPFSPNQPPAKASDLLSPELEIKALAGPMNKDQADTFRRRWKTPPRLTSAASLLTSPPNEQLPLGSSSPLSSYPNTVPRSRYTPNKSRLNNGSLTPRTPSTIEITPRKLFNGDTDENENDANGHVVVDSNSNEFQEPLVPSSDGNKRKLFMNYRQLAFRPNDSMEDSFISGGSQGSFNDTLFDTPSYKERYLKLADVDKGLEVIGRGLAKDHNVGWKEHWTFLDEFVDIASAEGLAKFDKYLSVREETKLKPPPAELPKIPFNERLTQLIESSPLSNICRDLSKFNLSRFRSATDTDVSGNSTSPPQSNSSPTAACNAYQCVEKSCQVFAKRFLKHGSQQPRNIALINDALTCELNRLKSLVCSYKEDPRFFAVDFRSAHSRFAHLIVWFLREDPTVIDLDTLNDFKLSLAQILESKYKSSCAEVSNSRTQLICLIKFLLGRLSDRDYLIAPETLITEQDCADVWSGETKCQCQWSVEQNHNKTMRALKRRQGNNKISGLVDVHHYRERKGDNLEENDFYLSLSESDDDDDSDVYYTPPESPTQMLSNPIEEYTNYIYGDVPTKMDNDVMTALHGVEIDGDTYPKVRQWHAAMQNHSLEDRNNFPPPLIGKPNPTTPVNPKRLFQSPAQIAPKRPLIQLKPSILSSNFND